MYNFSPFKLSYLSENVQIHLKAYVTRKLHVNMCHTHTIYFHIIIFTFHSVTIILNFHSVTIIFNFHSVTIILNFL